MATVEEIPSLDGLMESILDRLPPEAVAALASMRLKPARRRETFADQLVNLVQAKARARAAHGPKPSDDESELSELTEQTIRDVEAGKGLTRYDSLEDAFADLGI